MTTTRLDAWRPVLPILVGASVMLTIAMGLRQSLGIFMPALTRDVGISVAQFTIAIAVQNLVWGAFQPFAGAWAVRWGYRPLMLIGSVLYVLGLLALGLAQGLTSVVIGAGVAIGIAMAFSGSAIAMAVAARAVTPAQRSMILGIVSAAGSLGALIAAPVGQIVNEHWGWRAGVFAFLVLSLLMLPSAWKAGRVDALPMPTPPGGQDLGARQVLMQALRYPPFIVMAVAFFVCGMQLVFLTTHLPAYLEICGMDPMLSAQALGLIGGFNVLGSLFFGWVGGRYNKLLALGGIYVSRSITLAWYFMTPPTPASTLVFASIMGFLWLGVSPLVSGWIADTFGVKWQAMIGGASFFSHQIGSFVGAFGGGLLYDMLGNYEMAWRFGVGLGLVAGIVQMAFAYRTGRPPDGPARPGVTPTPQQA